LLLLLHNWRWRLVSPWRSLTALFATLAVRYLDAHAFTAQHTTVESAHGVQGVLWILKFDKSKAGRIACHENVAQLAVVTERPFDFVS
jgi:hypothetical protein